MSISSSGKKSTLVDDNHSTIQTSDPESLVMVEISVNETSSYLPPKISTYCSKINYGHEKEVTDVESSSQAYLRSSNPKVVNLANTPTISAIVSTTGGEISSSISNVVPLVSMTTNHDQEIEIATKNQKKSNQRTYLAQMLELARKGDSISQFNIGLIYFYGNGETQNYEKALVWFGMAAAQGDVQAQFNLGLMYKLGLGVTQNDAKAAQWFCKAAMLGDAYAQCNLGAMYYQGLGVTKNYEEAVNMYSMAAERGFSIAQSNLAGMYERGEGVEKSITNAVIWYQKAASQGHANAQFHLGLLYQSGVVVKKDIALAFNCYLKAAEQGHMLAQFNLGSMFLLGQEVQKNDFEAEKWLTKAAMQGHEQAKFICDLGIATDEMSMSDEGKAIKKM
jgi:TPR repeat protein